MLSAIVKFDSSISETFFIESSNSFFCSSVNLLYSAKGNTKIALVLLISPRALLIRRTFFPGVYSFETKAITGSSCKTFEEKSPSNPNLVLLAATLFGTIK